MQESKTPATEEIRPAGPATAVQDVLSLFDARCAERPDATAVVDGTSRRTYAQLDAESRGYARVLRARGAGPETVVAVTADRSAQYVAMVLGVLRAGAAFVPVEPTTPLRRAREMCRGAAVRVLFAQPAHQGYAAAIAAAIADGVTDGRAGGQEPAVCIAGGPASEPEPVRTGVPVEGLPAVRHPDGLAYVIFTSGSTGVPKGAMVTHGGMANHSTAKVLDLGLGPDDVVAFTAPLSFDISVWQALTALTAGARVCVAAPEDLAEPTALAQWVEDHAVTVLEIVPSFLAVVLDQLEGDARIGHRMRSLRMLIATGEALPGPLGLRWHRSGPGAALLNAYGPTECSDDVTHHVVTEAECVAEAWPAIGREIINTRIHVVDDEGREQPAGVQGDLWVGGDGVGRGYIGDPVRTALAFVPDHFSDVPGARLYRTGDRGDRAADGVVRYAGRSDRQVKVRGHRIELGDVEAELLRLAEVTAAACVLVEGRLKAFVTLRSASGQEPAGLLARVRQSAPRWLVPHELAVLDRMPTGSSGKVDLRALAGPATATARAAVVGAADDGGDDRLAAVRATVAEVLDIPSIGPDDDFFAAGGDSLRAMTLVSLARTRFDAEAASLRGFLGTPTARGLLAALEAAEAETPAVDLPRDSGSLSSGQERLWFLEQLHPQRPPLLVRLSLELNGPLDLRALQHALNATVRRHEPLRTVFSSERGLPVATVRPHAEVPLVVVPASEAPADGAVVRSGLSVRTAEPPLMEARLVETAPDRHVLTLLLHHLVADGWSLRALGHEICSYYEQWTRGVTEVPLPQASYSRYVSAERQWLTSREGKKTEEYWARRLAGAPPVIDLPLDRPRQASPDFTAAYVLHELTGEETAALAALARELKATPFMVVVAALYAVLRELTGSDDLVVGIDSANRSWPGSEDLIGTFVNQLPLRLAAPRQDLDFRELVELVRRESLSAYEYDRLPFHKIVAAVNPPRQAGRFPLFQVKATQQGLWGEGLSLPGVEVVPGELSEPATDLDLMLDVSGEDSRLRLELVYRTELVDEATASAWVAAIGAVLRTGTTSGM
jgi:amino acid adenylation domain-containing protein